MSDEHQSDNSTVHARAWRLGGPMTDEQRAKAKELFIASLKRVHSVTLACEKAKISRQTAYDWRQIDVEFATQWENAVERDKDIARQSIYERGILGWDEPVVNGGMLVYEYEPLLGDDGKQKFDSKGKPIMLRSNPVSVHKWSDTLAVAYAKANLPEYKEKQQIEHTGPGGGPLQQQIEIYKVRLPDNGRDMSEPKGGDA